MTDCLIAYMAEEKVGTLLSAGRDGLTFQYDQNWLAMGAPQLSSSLPCRDEAYGPTEATPFFDNLLPESNVRTSLARYFRVAESNTFELLRVLGGDCAGAITILSADQAPDAAGSYEPLNKQQLEQLLLNPGGLPFGAGAEGVRLSLAGAQAKLPVHFDGETFSLPKGTASSTHIIKPPINGIAETVPNEAFCMRLAAVIGLRAPDIEIYRGLRVPVYVIKRYDRHMTLAGRLVRIPQEDFCQALGILPDYKYEADGGPSLQACFDLVDQQFTNPASDRLALLDWVLFNLLIGNADAHAKNISMLRLPLDLRLAPFYDLLCTAVYPNLTTNLAMKIGGKDDADYLYPIHLQRFADAIGVKERLIAQRLARLIENISLMFGRVAEVLELQHSELAMLKKIAAVFDQRQRKLSSLLLV